MLKKRLIPILYIKNGFIVRSEIFKEHKYIGNVVNEVRRYSQWNIDELIYIDITTDKTYDTLRDDHKIERIESIDKALELIAKECFTPLTFGGGIRDLETIKRYFKNGADKVTLNTILHEDEATVREAVSMYGSQAIVASLDYKIENGIPVFYSNYGTKKLNISLNDILEKTIDLGCGEILLNSIDRDGTGEGYDINTIKKVVDLSTIPVIAAGGAMDVFDFKELAQIENISGIAAGNMFHFTENVYPRAKNTLKNNNLNFR